MPEEPIKIGEKVKSLRAKKKLSLEDVAAKTGLDATMIAAIEAATVDPPLGNIVSLADAFQVTVGELLGDDADSAFCIVRGGNRKTVSRFGSAEGKGGGYRYESLGHRMQNRHMEPFLVTLTPGGSRTVEANQHIGEEILFVLEGEVEVRLAEHADLLYPGDSIYYDSSLPHVVSCHGEKPATLLAVIYAKKEMIIP